MARRESGQEGIRKLGKTGSAQNPSYFVTLPISFVRELGWRDGQKLELSFNENDGSIVVKDAKFE